VAQVYFAGHAATFDDTPYVVPDAELSSLSEVPYELVSLETLIGKLRRTKRIDGLVNDALSIVVSDGAVAETQRHLQARPPQRPVVPRKLPLARPLKSRPGPMLDELNVTLQLDHDVRSL
jgi:hypothetical protein